MRLQCIGELHCLLPYGFRYLLGKVGMLFQNLLRYDNLF